MSIFDRYFDKIFVINLDFRKDKWNDMENMFKKFKIKNYERFSAIQIDFDKIPEKYITKNKKSKIIIIGSYGCLLSHYNVIKISKDRGYKRVLILEDDAQLLVGGEIVLENSLPSLDKRKWDMLYLGGHDLGNMNSSKINDFLFKITGVYATHAYAINEHFFEYILDNIIEFNGAIDNFYVNLQKKNLVDSICLNKFIFIQRPGYSDIVQKHVDYKRCNPNKDLNKDLNKDPNEDLNEDLNKN